MHKPQKAVVVGVAAGSWLERAEMYLQPVLPALAFSRSTGEMASLDGRGACGAQVPQMLCNISALCSV